MSVLLTSVEMSKRLFCFRKSIDERYDATQLSVTSPKLHVLKCLAPRMPQQIANNYYFIH